MKVYDVDCLIIMETLNTKETFVLNNLSLLRNYFSFPVIHINSIEIKIHPLYRSDHSLEVHSEMLQL